MNIKIQNLITVNLIGWPLSCNKKTKCIHAKMYVCFVKYQYFHLKIEFFQIFLADAHECDTQ